MSLFFNVLQHQQRALAELKVQNARLEVTLAQQTTALAAPLTQLETAPHFTLVADG